MGITLYVFRLMLERNIYTAMESCWRQSETYTIESNTEAIFRLQARYWRSIQYKLIHFSYFSCVGLCDVWSLHGIITARSGTGNREELGEMQGPGIKLFTTFERPIQNHIKHTNIILDTMNIMLLHDGKTADIWQGVPILLQHPYHAHAACQQFIVVLENGTISVLLFQFL